VCTHFLLLLLFQVVTQDRTGHKDPVRGALYNAAFAVVVSVDEAGTTCVWNLQVNLQQHLWDWRCGGDVPWCVHYYAHLGVSSVLL
jgi:hypothetical protein